MPSSHYAAFAHPVLMSRLHGELARFLMVGVGSNLLNFVIYLFAYAAGIPLVAAAAAGYMAGLINSYHFGRNWVFDAGDLAGKMAILRFAVVYTIGGIGMSAIIETLDRTQGLDYRLSWFFGAVFAFTNNFLGSKWLVFKGREKHNGN